MEYELIILQTPKVPNFVYDLSFVVGTLDLAESMCLFLSIFITLGRIFADIFPFSNFDSGAK